MKLGMRGVFRGYKPDGLPLEHGPDSPSGTIPTSSYSGSWLEAPVQGTVGDRGGGKGQCETHIVRGSGLEANQQGCKAGITITGNAHLGRSLGDQCQLHRQTARRRQERQAYRGSMPLDLRQLQADAEVQMADQSAMPWRKRTEQNRKQTAARTGRTTRKEREKRLGKTKSWALVKQGVASGRWRRLRYLSRATRNDMNHGSETTARGIQRVLGLVRWEEDQKETRHWTNR